MTREKVKWNKLEVSGQPLDVLLMVLDMYDYDIISGMDWLSAHQASIDCYKKEIVFTPDGKERLVSGHEAEKCSQDNNCSKD